MSSIMGQVRPDWSVLSAVESVKLLLLYSSIYKYKPFSTNIGQHLYDQRISDEMGLIGLKQCELFALQSCCI